MQGCWRLLLAACVCVVAAGCESIGDAVSGMFDDKMPVDAAVVAEWVDGPRIRPGVRLLIQVGTSAAAPARMEVQVDQGGNITLPLLLQEPVSCYKEIKDGETIKREYDTLDDLKKKLVTEYLKYYK